MSERDIEMWLTENEAELIEMLRERVPEEFEIVIAYQGVNWETSLTGPHRTKKRVTITIRGTGTSFDFAWDTMRRTDWP